MSIEFDKKIEGGALLRARPTKDQLKLIEEITYALDINPDPPTAGCNCSRCATISVVAIAAMKLQPEELKRTVDDINSKRRELFTAAAMANMPVEQLTDKLNAMLFESLQGLHQKILAIPELRSMVQHALV